MALPTYRLTRDLVIPAGTVIDRPPTSSSRWRKDFEGVVAIDRDHTAYFSFDLQDGIRTGLVQVGPVDDADFRPDPIEESDVKNATAALEALTRAAGDAADALERLGRQPHGGVVLESLGGIVHIEIKPAPPVIEGTRQTVEVDIAPSLEALADRPL